MLTALAMDEPQGGPSGRCREVAELRAELIAQAEREAARRVPGPTAAELRTQMIIESERAAASRRQAMLAEFIAEARFAQANDWRRDCPRGKLHPLPGWKR